MSNPVGEIVSINISGERGVKKTPIPKAVIKVGVGIEGDAHAGFGHRLVSLLADESVDKMRGKGMGLGPGDFAENITTRGVELASLPVGTRIRMGRDVLLRVTQIGKECHAHCEIFKTVGSCIMPVEGIFAEALVGGELVPGDRIEIMAGPAVRLAVLTVSDRGARGERADASGKWLCEQAPAALDAELIDYIVVPDELDVIADKLVELADSGRCDLVITTGGTGFSVRDMTPEATKRVVEREAFGIPMLMMLRSLEVTDKAALARYAAGIRGRTLIVNMPGSPKAVAECFEALSAVLGHGIEMLKGEAEECHARFHNPGSCP